jgi:hypothetical protein
LGSVHICPIEHPFEHPFERLIIFAKTGI